MAVYGYVRVSTDMQAEDGQSLAVQQRQLEGWAMQHGRVFDAMHIEAGISGAIPFAERPEGSRLWARLTKGDVLVASKLDRMFRSAGDCLTVVETLKARGVSLYLLDLNGGADDVSGSGIARLFLTIVSAFAEFERDRIGERIRATKRAQKARGEYLGGRPPFGWRVGDGGALVVDLEQQQALERMRALRTGGASLRAIAATMTADGIQVSHEGVKKILVAADRAAA
jgi:DNA invertase Pin-like site-specific DNA recombinase